jgi:hypothetical protein
MYNRRASEYEKGKKLLQFQEFINIQEKPAIDRFNTIISRLDVAIGRVADTLLILTQI